MTSSVGRVAAVVCGLGVTLALGAGYLIVRGPFLGGPLLAPRSLLVALGAFLFGVAVAAWGGTQYVRA